MSVANPWIVESPAPDTPQTPWGVPASWFSVVITLDGVSRSSRPFKIRRARPHGEAPRRDAGRGRRFTSPFINRSSLEVFRGLRERDPTPTSTGLGAAGLGRPPSGLPPEARVGLRRTGEGVESDGGPTAYETA